MRHTPLVVLFCTVQSCKGARHAACKRSGPREDATRIGSAGVIRRQAVDISPLRRVNSAIYLLTTGARESAFRNVKTIAECLADELINAAKGSSNRYPRLLPHTLSRACNGRKAGVPEGWQRRHGPCE